MVTEAYPLTGKHALQPLNMLLNTLVEMLATTTRVETGRELLAAKAPVSLVLTLISPNSKDALTPDVLLLIASELSPVDALKELLDPLVFTLPLTMLLLPSVVLNPLLELETMEILALTGKLVDLPPLTLSNTHAVPTMASTPTGNALTTSRTEVPLLAQTLELTNSKAANNLDALLHTASESFLPDVLKELLDLLLHTPPRTTLPPPSAV
jgi:hypothetical protein